jgi:hypothetical protein
MSGNTMIAMPNNANEKMSMNNVGTNLIFENEKIKVWELFLRPGERIECHTHKLDYVFYVLEGGTIGVYDADDRQVSILEIGAGDTLAFYPEGDCLRASGGTISAIPAHHGAKNIGDTIYREILIEMKQ